MVSEVQTVSSQMTLGNGRGFIPEETVVAAGPNNTQITYYRPFWRPVLAGSFFAISVFVLSWFLMLGCHVGVANTGMISLGAGAAVWLCVTACVAYFFGGMIASAMTASGMPFSASGSSGSLKGAVIWAASMPLALVIYGFVAQSARLLPALALPQPGMTESAVGNGLVYGAHYGFYWSMFIGVALALIFAIVGGMTGCACRKSS